MQPMVVPKSESFYVTLSAAGNGSVQFTARKSGVITSVSKVTIEMGMTGSGRVSVFKNGGFMSSMPVAPRMEANGKQDLYASEYLTVQIEDGPADVVAKVVFFWTERPEQ